MSRLSPLTLLLVSLTACPDPDPPLPLPPPPPPLDCARTPADPRCPPPPPPPIDCTKTPTIAECQPRLDCTRQPTLPLEARTWIGDVHHGREPEHRGELVFDGRGNLFGVDRAGNVFRQTREGVRSTLAAGAVRSARGVAFLSTGELLIADSGVSALTAVYPGGEVRHLLVHLDLPSGLEVDGEDRVYISEALGRTIRRFDPATGTSTVVVRYGSWSPSALAFGPDERVLYVVDDRDGSVYAVDRAADGSFSAPRVFLRAESTSGGGGCADLGAGAACPTPRGVGSCEVNESGVLACQFREPCEGRAPGDNCRGDFFLPGTCQGDEQFMTCAPPDPCAGRRVGESCVTEPFITVGTCVDNGAGLSCQQTTASCVGRLPGDRCTDFEGNPGVCDLIEGSPDLFCVSLGACFGKQEGDTCNPGFGADPGVCVSDGAGGLFCTIVDPCAFAQLGDPCVASGQPGTCELDPFNQLICVVRDDCQGLEEGAACTTAAGGAGSCRYDSRTGFLLCAPPPPCGQLFEGSTCTEGGLQGVCTDDFAGGVFCQTSEACAGREVGEVCAVSPGWGYCDKNAEGVAFCDPFRPCGGVPAGSRCYAPYVFGGGVCREGERSLFCAGLSAGGGCDGAQPGSPCASNEGTPGICREEGEGLVCQALTCADLPAGGACALAGGAPGVCANDDGTPTCLVVDPCAGRAAGQSCQGGAPGTCVDDGRGRTFCRREAACAGDPAGAACTSKDTGRPGSCRAAAGDALVCETSLPCAGKAEADSCQGEAGAAGNCQRGGGGALVCRVEQERFVARAIETDACGWVYLSAARSGSLYRVSADGGTRQLVASTLHTPISSVSWGSGVGGWKDQSLYLGVRGGATVLELELGLTGRKISRPTRTDRTPGPVINDLSACLRLASAPLQVTELGRARGYHDVGVTAEGELVGSDGSVLVAVDRQDSLRVYAPVSGAEGFDFLPDGTMISTSGEGIVRVSPEGAVSPLAPGLYAYGLTVGPDGKAYAGTNAQIQRIDPVTGTTEVYLDPTMLSDPFSARTIQFDGDQTLMAIGSFGDGVFTMPLNARWNPAGTPRRLATIYGGGPFLDGLAMDRCGNLYVPSYSHSALYRVSLEGEVHLLWDVELTQYGHGVRFGRNAGGWRADALYLPQPYDSNTVVELVVGVTGARR